MIEKLRKHREIRKHNHLQPKKKSVFLYSYFVKCLCMCNKCK